MEAEIFWHYFRKNNEPRILPLIWFKLFTSYFAKASLFTTHGIL
jgi:hypothetical protein